MRYLIACLFIGFSPVLMANWLLDADASTLHFISTKKQHIAETHHFKALSGDIDDKGNVTVKIDLTSVETNIPIRNERMMNYLFQTMQWPSAVITAKVPQDVLSMAVGERKHLSLPLTLNLHGATSRLDADLLAIRLSNGSMQVSAISPLVVDTRSFNMTKGVEKLKELAGLDHISFTVPVQYSLSFHKE